MVQSNIAPAAADLLPAVVETVSEAGAMIRAEFHRCGGPRGSGSKAPIDTEVEQVLKDRLLGLHACGFVGEETGRVRASGSDVWAVDPPYRPQCLQEHHQQDQPEKPNKFSSLG